MLRIFNDMKKKLNRNQINSIIICALVFLVGVLIILVGLTKFNLFLFIGLLVIAIGALTTVFSIRAESEKRKYFGPDSICGIVLFFAGIILLDVNSAVIVFRCFSFFAMMLGIGIALDAILSKLCKKTKFLFKFLMGIALCAVGVCLFLIKELAELNEIFLGLTVIVYSLHLTYVKIFTKREEVPLEEEPIKEKDFY